MDYQASDSLLLEDFPMNTRLKLISLATITLLLSFLNLPLVIAQPATTAVAEIEVQQAEAVESKFLEQWLGEWEGTGTSYGRTVRDRMILQ